MSRRQVITMKTNENPNKLTQKHEEFIVAQNALIEQMKETIVTLENEINCLKELNLALKEENTLLQKFNDKILDNVHRMLNES